VSTERDPDNDSWGGAAAKPAAAEPAAAESAELEADVSSTGPLSGRIQAGLLGVVAVATLVMFALGLILLLSYL